MVIRDIMCDPAGSNRKILMNEIYTSVGIGYGRGNSLDARTNTKSVYVLLFGKDPAVTAPPIMPPKDGNCTNWSIQSACMDAADKPAPTNTTTPPAPPPTTTLTPTEKPP